MDDIDRIQELEDSKLAASIAAISRFVATAVDDPECVDCGEEIPLERRTKMPSARRCVDCQGTFERGTRVKRF
jgi:phage/conjugal plasmid C-4 type zinc finger TraR family protein